MWLFDTIKKSWHMWNGAPIDGAAALCGLPKTDACTMAGDGHSNEKCLKCVAERAKAAVTGK